MARTLTDAIRELRAELQIGIRLVHAATAAEDAQERIDLKTSFLAWLRAFFG